MKPEGTYYCRRCSTYHNLNELYYATNGALKCKLTGSNVRIIPRHKTSPIQKKHIGHTHYELMKLTYNWQQANGVSYRIATALQKGTW